MDGDLQDWNVLSDEFKGSDLLLGNGFSRNFSDRFSYDSLFSEFIQNTDQADKIKKFNTTNFESILKDLQIAKKVNDYFAIESNELSNIYEEVKNGLVESITKLHPKFDDLNAGKLDLSSKIISSTFRNIYTTNYDSIIYHIILKINDWHQEDKRITKFSDYFWGDIDSSFYKAFTGIQNYPVKKVFYLHGALFIYEIRQYILKRIRGRNDSELLDLITESIGKGEIPIFVSEGDANQKKQAINSNGYLTFANNHFRDETDSLTIFGFGFSKQDEHILESINRKRRRIAISIYRGSQSQDEIRSKKNEIESKLNKQSVEYFDSTTLF